MEAQNDLESLMETSFKSFYDNIEEHILQDDKQFVAGEKVNELIAVINHN